MKYHAIVIEDVYAVEALKNLLQGIFPEIHICCNTNSIPEGELVFKKQQPEIVFINISFAGIFEFIFSPAFALQKQIIVFTFNAGESCHAKLLANGLDFLVKPFSADAASANLPQAMQHYELLQTDPDAVRIYNQSLMNLRNQVENHRPIEEITIPVRFGYQIISLSGLVYLQADENYTILYLTDSQVVVSNLEIDRFLQFLPAGYFFQINAFTIINIRFLKIRSGPSGKTLLMSDGTVLSVSKRRLAALDKKVALHKNNTDSH